MIGTLYYAIGFIIYFAFCYVTFVVYSKKKEMSKMFILIFIYIYYTLLAGYVINLVDVNGNLFERLVQIAIYAIACGLMMMHYYSTVIKKEDDEMSNSLYKGY